ncbi:ermin isoform X1 [Erinaceus europaeus]|uniref:Ermin n=1 Tax=Erinaceus europaeus TaxID=9365 RepID=A0ABM3WBD7_ERIEU|nr:ermin isoform X1 [Erinaceus europaeus]
MTDAPLDSSQAECNGDTLSENRPFSITEISKKAHEVDGTPAHYREEPHLEEGLPTAGSKEKGEIAQSNEILNQSMEEEMLQENLEEHLFIVHKAITDLSLQEASVDDMTFREAGQQWGTIPLAGSHQEPSRPAERIAEYPQEEKEEAEENRAQQTTEIEWLGFEKPKQIHMLPSEYHGEQEVWAEDISEDEDDCNEEEDEVREMELQKEMKVYSQFKEGGKESEDSALRIPCSQPVIPEELPAFGRKSDISRNAYSRYNTISYRKIRKGNTKQRIDEFESMMNL